MITEMDYEVKFFFDNMTVITTVWLDQSGIGENESYATVNDKAIDYAKCELFNHFNMDVEKFGEYSTETLLISEVGGKT